MSGRVAPGAGLAPKARRARRTPPGAADRAVAYIRASTDEQHLGPEDQRKALADWATTRGVQIVEFFEETISGTVELDRRPRLLEAIEALRRHGAGVLVASRRDRFARNLFQAELLEMAVARHGGRVATIEGAGEGDAPEAVFVRQVVGAASQYEGALIRVRTRGALRAKLARGEAAGGCPPLGQRIEGNLLVACIEEQAAVRRAAELRAAGVSWPRVTATLRTEGHVPRGRGWHAAPLARAIARLLEASR